MIYIKVRWVHNFVDEPIEIYCELDDSRSEVRKIEIYPDGKIGYASKNQNIYGSELSVEPIPDLKEIAKDKQFIPECISKIEFENIWAKATKV